ncbi:MAG: hypothetical protein U9Q83_06175 [Bacteroidota bacterium]|nr:hypothetical protein [Bacteroidota bacterium]
MIKIVKHISRIIFAIVLSLLGLQFFDFGTFGNMFMFMAVYIGASLMIEPLFNYWEEKQNKTKNNDK